MTRERWFLAAALLGMAMPCLAAPAPAGAQAVTQLQAPCLSLAPTGGPSGTSVEVIGGDRTPGVAVSISIGSVALGTTIADAAGGFSTRITIPFDAPQGGWTITASGGPAGCASAAVFHVVDARAPAPDPPGGVSVDGLWDVGAAAVILAAALVLAVRRRRSAGDTTSP